MVVAESEIGSATGAFLNVLYVGLNIIFPERSRELPLLPKLVVENALALISEDTGCCIPNPVAKAEGLLEAGKSKLSETGVL